MTGYASGGGAPRGGANGLAHGGYGGSSGLRADSFVKDTLELLCGRLGRCIAMVQAQSSDFKPRAYLLPELEETLRLASAAASEARLAAGSSVNAVGQPQRRDSSSAWPNAVLLPALTDAVSACLLVLALLEDAPRAGGAQDARHERAFVPPEVAFWPSVALRGQARRLKALRPLLEAEASGGSVPAEWDPCKLFLSGSLAAFWRRHFPTCSTVLVGDLAAALGSWFEALEPDELSELMRWLPEDDVGHVNIADVALVLDGPGLWRSILFCTSWLELCPQEVMLAVMAGGGDRHVAMTAADLAAERRQKAKSALLDEWSRERLQSDRASFHALRALGVEVVADASRGSVNGGLLVQFPFPRLAQIVVSGSQSLTKVCQELLGGAGLAARPVANVSLAQCVANTAASSWRIKEPRDQHIAFSRIHRRKRYELSDSMQDILSLQRQHRELVRAHMRAKGLETDLPTEPPEPPSTAADGASGSTPLQPELLRSIQEAQSELYMWISARIEAELRNSAGEGKDDRLETQLAHLCTDAAYADTEEVLEAEMNICALQSTAASQEMLRVDQTLLSLENLFAKLRSQLLVRNRELDKHVAQADVELASLSGNLVLEREAAHAAADAALDSRLRLAEVMLPLPLPPLGSPSYALPPTNALEDELARESEALRARAEQLEKEYKKARAAKQRR